MPAFAATSSQRYEKRRKQARFSFSSGHLKTRTTFFQETFRIFKERPSRSSAFPPPRDEVTPSCLRVDLLGQDASIDTYAYWIQKGQTRIDESQSHHHHNRQTLPGAEDAWALAAWHVCRMVLVSWRRRRPIEGLAITRYRGAERQPGLLGQQLR